MFATREDIYACFRLLLGRSPNPEEITGHFDRVGAPLEPVVSSYLNSLEFRNRGLCTPSQSAELISVERFGVYVASDDQLIAPDIRSGYQPEVTRVFTEHLRADSCVLDIGANCGYYSLLACSFGCEVYAFEPLLRNLRLLAASRIYNRFDRQLHIVAAAASDASQTLVIGASYTNGVVGPVPGTAAAALDADYIAAVCVDASIPSDTRVGLIKIDVEGHEYRALMGAARAIERSHPVIISEFAPAALTANSLVSPREYLELIASWGYSLSVVGAPAMNTFDLIVRSAENRDHIDIIAVPS